ncbi:MAG: hypothetical protein JF593_08005 [Novosphingobium sp.]|nr:hypothetical protein [Novosphingobium sp.]
MKPFTTIAAVLFAIVALLHLVRLIRHFPAVIGGWSVPMWVSILGVVVPAFLAIMLMREARRV